jgi:serine/threonine-protein kinase
MLDTQRLQQLEALEKSSTDDSDPSKRAQRLMAFKRRLDDVRNQAEQQDRIIAAVNGVGSLVVQIPITDEISGAAQTLMCTNDAVRVATAGSRDREQLPRVRLAEAPGTALCAAARAVGHGHFWSDEDGYVRRAQLAVRAGDRILPAVSLAAEVLASTRRAITDVQVGHGVLYWEGASLRTDPNTSVLTRFYGGARGPKTANDDQNRPTAFVTVRADDVLAGNRTTALLARRIVVLGDMQADASGGISTPMSESMPLVTLVATGVSNMLERDYLVRPAWLAWLEAALIIGTAILIAFASERFQRPVFVLMALFLATAAIATEVFMLEFGVWLQMASVAVFVTVCTILMAVLDRKPREHPQRGAAPARNTMTGAQPLPSQDGLDLAFSVLRQQAPSEHVKSRLYEISVTHVRQRDLAKAERVLRHLASIDPGYRNVSEKLKKLAGMRAGMEQRDSRGLVESKSEHEPEQQQEAVAAQQAPARKTLGRYEIESVLGQGAMATVYLGRDPKINRRVAIKTIALAEEFSDAELENARAQFVREAESAGRLNHPAIIAVYDVGDDDDIAYLAMEYFPGKSLAQHAHSGKLLPPKKVLDLISRAADGLHYAHGQRVVHRDIKPANLLYDADTDTVKITDFGIARLTDSSRTKTGIVLGTPSYMSPEQLAGTEVTGQSDIFSLGITLYQLLVGVPPFRADSIPKLMQRIAKEKHDPVRSLRPDLPQEIDEILDRALEKNPDNRFPSARALALALRDCCSRFGAANALRA